MMNRRTFSQNDGNSRGSIQYFRDIQSANRKENRISCSSWSMIWVGRIWVVSDQSFYETPNIDRLCKESMKFTNAYAACPVCSPTRASIMAGKYPARMDTTDWFGAPQPDTVQNHWTRNKPLLPAHYKEEVAVGGGYAGRSFQGRRI